MAPGKAERRKDSLLLQAVINEKYTDLTIESKDKYFKVHKLVLCNQSDYFATAVQESRFSEGKTGVIKFDDETHAVEAMIQYLYTTEYALQSDPPAGSDDKNACGASTSANPVSIGTTDVLLVHLDVMALADRILLPSLCELAHQKFQSTLETGEVKSYYKLIKSVYQLCPPNDFGEQVRTTLARHVCSDMYRLLVDVETRDEIVETMEELGVFGRDLALFQSLGTLSSEDALCAEQKPVELRRLTSLHHRCTCGGMGKIISRDIFRHNGYCDSCDQLRPCKFIDRCDCGTEVEVKLQAVPIKARCEHCNESIKPAQLTMYTFSMSVECAPVADGTFGD